MNKFCVVILIFFLFPQAVFAVCLDGKPSVPKELEKRVDVVIGEVAKVEEVPEAGRYYDGFNYTVRIIETLKGNLTGVITIFSENSSGRFFMDIGESYILFLYEDSGVRQVDNCGNSGLLSEKQDVIQKIRNLSRKK